MFNIIANFKKDNFEELKKSFSELDLNQIFSMNTDEDNTKTPGIRERIANIIYQLRKDNNSHYQALNLILVE